MPYSFLKAIEETTRETLRQGIYGWQVTDCQVTLVYSAYYPRQSHAHAHFDKSMSSTAGDFRNLTPLVLMAALREAGTIVLEPMHRFELELPTDVLGPALPVLARLGVELGSSVARDAMSLLEGEIPAASVHQLRQQLPGLTRGDFVFDCAFHRYQPVRGPNPTRPRSDHNPLDRKEYLLRVKRGVVAGPL